MDYEDFISRISEGVRAEKLYHASYSWGNILEEGKLNLSLMDNDEVRLVNTAYPGFIGRYGERFASFARSMNSRYIKLRGSDIVTALEFDGRLLRRDYKIVPVDWFSTGERSVRARSHGKSEEEERLVSKIKKYLTGVHVYVPSYQRLSTSLKNLMGDLAHARSRPDAYPPGNHKAILKVAEQDVEQARKRVANIMDGILEHMHLYPDVPVWLYSTKDAFNNARWADASQINHLMDDPHEDEDEDEDNEET
jgi:hypothetical protein